MCTYLGPSFDPQRHDYSQPVPYCANPSLPGKSYCAEHYPVVYNAGSALRKRHKDMRRADGLRQLISDLNHVVEELEAEGFDFDAPADVEELEA